MKAIKAIMTFFEKDGGRKVTLDEMKKLTPEERKEFGELACKELREQFEQ